MAPLSASRRKSLPASDFAIPGSREYPIHDRTHAANALARASGKPEEATVRAAVCRRYPDLGACGERKMADPGEIPGINWKQVTPEERARLKGLIEHYRKEPHPFTACVRDNRKRFGPGRVERICAVLKDLIEGGTDWRKGSKAMSEDDLLTRDEVAAVCEAAEAILSAREFEFVEGLHPRQPAGATGGGRFKAKNGGQSTPKKGKAKTIRWGGQERNRQQLLDRLQKTGVPVEAWAWKHKAAARRLGIPVPTSEPTAALRRLQAVERRAGARSQSTSLAKRGLPGGLRAMSEGEREFAYNPNQRRAARGSSIGGRWIKMKPGTEVRLTNPLSPGLSNIPAKVVRDDGGQSVTVETRDGKTFQRHKDSVRNKDSGKKVGLDPPPGSTAGKDKSASPTPEAPPPPSPGGGNRPTTPGVRIADAGTSDAEAARIRRARQRRQDAADLRSGSPPAGPSITPSASRPSAPRTQAKTVRDFRASLDEAKANGMVDSQANLWARDMNAAVRENDDRKAKILLANLRKTVAALKRSGGGSGR